MTAEKTISSLSLTASANEDAECSLSYFEEADQFLSGLQTLLTSFERHVTTPSTQSAADTKLSQEEAESLDNESKICATHAKIIDKYQQIPQLLDSYLDRIITPIINILRQAVLLSQQSEALQSRFQSKDCPEGIRLHRLCKLLYQLSKLRGWKTIVKFFTHDPPDLEPLLAFTSSLPLPNEEFSIWETRYILIIWLSLIIMIPFDLKRVDSNWGNPNAPSLVDRVMTLGKTYLAATGKEHESAAVMLARLLTRKDTSATHLPKFLEWATQQSLETTDMFFFKGLLTSLAYIYKFGLRDILYPTLDACLPILKLFHSETSQRNSVVRKLLVKTAQRVGMNYLKQRIAKWRYQRGNRSLLDNLKSNETAATATSGNQSEKRPQDAVEEEDDEDVPEAMEDIIEILLDALRDKDTIVRWSAAKGIGRICYRLPKHFAEEVITSVIDLFSQDTFSQPSGELDFSAVSDSTWHGACLAIAELARRGLLLPDRLEQVIGWLVKALKFDQPKLSHSVGSHVRDAACYVAWSFARAYTPQVMNPYVPVLAKTLVVVACYDREVNVRRASSAAVQEHVGRQGIFPNGIELVTTADYFTVGNRLHSFLDVALQIAEFGDDYRHELIDHLVKTSTIHWDKAIREVAAKALGKLTLKDTDYVVETVIPVLIRRSDATDLAVRHGSLLSLANVCASWAVARGDIDALTTNQPLIKRILDILPNYSTSYLNTFGSDLTRQGCCALISSLTVARFPLSDAVANNFIDIIESTLQRKEEWLVDCAVESARQVARHPVAQPHIKSRLETWFSYIRPEKDKSFRRGFTLVIGTLSKDILDGMYDRVFDLLCQGAKFREEKMLNDAESKRNAIFALTMIFVNLGRDDVEKAISKNTFNLIVTTLLEGTIDYSVDSRGDVGSWIREASMTAFGSILPIVQGNGSWFTPELSRNVFAHLLQQSVEKIDKVRECAGKVLRSLVEGNVSHIYGRDRLEAVLKHNENLNWLSPADVYPHMVPLLRIPEYRPELLTGLVVSVGGMTESLVRHASAQLVEFVASLPSKHNEENTVVAGEMTLEDFSEALLQIFDKFHKQDRVIVPLLDVLDCLFGMNLFVSADVDFYNRLYDALVKEMFKSKDVRKLISGVKVLLNMLYWERDSEEANVIKSKCLTKSMSYLVHPFPRVRRVTGETLYIAVTSCGVLERVYANNDAELDSAMGKFEELMLSTNWDLSVAELKGAKESIVALLSI